jgi:GABA permease
MVRLLLVANKTLTSGEVSDFVRDRIAKDDNCQFTLLVPASPHERQPGARMANEIATAGSGARASDASVGEDDWEYARGRLEYGLGILRRLGATVDGEVGDPNPAKAISDVLKRRSYDEVALSTLPKGVSRWLGLDIPHQVQRRFHVPVTVITGKSVPR